MLKTLRSRSLVVMGLAVAVVALSSVADASHAWGNYHWARTANPFTLKVGNNVTTIAWNNALDTAIADWTQSSVMNLTEVAGGTRPKSCRPTTGRIEVCNAAYGPNGWLGLAQIWASGSHITQATTKVNDTYFNTATYNTTAWRNMVMCQEIGHDFGLAHQDENFDNPNLGSCMDYTSDPSTNQHPNQHDYQMLEQIYSHLDSTTTIGASVNGHSPAMNAAQPSTRSAFGRLVASSRDGRSEYYELDFGRGQRILTHVIWAEGHEHGRNTE